MGELNVFTLHAGLEREQGLEAVYLSDKSTTSLVYLISPRGLPVQVGWFDNRRKSVNEPDNYALTTHPAEITNTHHRIILAQYKGNENLAYLTEERSADYLEGYDHEPTIVNYDQLGQPDIGIRLRSYVLGSCVLPASVGYDLSAFEWRNAYDVAAVEAYGRALIDAGKYLVQVDDAMLNAYTA